MLAPHFGGVSEKNGTIHHCNSSGIRAPATSPPARDETEQPELSSRWSIMLMGERKYQDVGQYILYTECDGQQRCCNPWKGSVNPLCYTPPRDQQSSRCIHISKENTKNTKNTGEFPNSKMKSSYIKNQRPPSCKQVALAVQGVGNTEGGGGASKQSWGGGRAPIKRTRPSHA